MVARTLKGESIRGGPEAAGEGLFVLCINQMNHVSGVLGLEEFGGAGGELWMSSRQRGGAMDEVCERASAFRQDPCPALISSWVVTGQHVALRCVLTHS